MKKIFWVVPTAIIGLAIAKRAGLLETTSSSQTAPNAAEPALRTRVYTESPAEVRDTVKSAIAGQTTYGRPWHVVAEREDGAVAIRVEVPVLVFTDDLTVTVSPHDSGSRVDVHSAARIGRGDFGENRRHVLQLLNALDAVLHSAPDAPLPDRRQLPRESAPEPLPAGD